MPQLRRRIIALVHDVTSPSGPVSGHRSRLSLRQEEFARYRINSFCPKEDLMSIPVRSLSAIGCLVAVFLSVPAVGHPRPADSFPTQATYSFDELLTHM